MDGRLLKKLTAYSGLPSSPAAAAQIVELAQQKTASNGTVADAVKMDPSLAAKILRIANSPLCGQHRPNDKLTVAVMLYGLIAALQTNRCTAQNYTTVIYRCVGYRR